MKILPKKVIYLFGPYYYGLKGILHNFFDKPKINPQIENWAIGKTVEGREVKIYKICKNETQFHTNKILFVGGIHGNEVGSIKLVIHLANWLHKNHQSLIKSHLKEIYILPGLNLDGYIYAKKHPDYWQRGLLGRFNKNNVDLNRNFSSSNWQEHAEWEVNRLTREKIKVSAGQTPASEPEVQVLINFIKNSGINNLIMLHNMGKEIFVDLNNEIEKKWAEIYHQQTGFKIKPDPNESGSVGPWARENGINCLTIEGRERWRSNWQEQKYALLEILNNYS